MLTESCVMFFSPSRAVLTAILRDECLTSAARDGEKIMTHVPLPLPRHSFFFFALVPAFYTNLARKRLLRSLRILALLQGKTLIETAH